MNFGTKFSHFILLKSDVSYFLTFPAKTSMCVINWSIFKNFMNDLISPFKNADHVDALKF